MSAAMRYTERHLARLRLARALVIGSERMSGFYGAPTAAFSGLWLP
jgi:hypothetical protein